jgi:hypothetical protein
VADSLAHLGQQQVVVVALALSVELEAVLELVPMVVTEHQIV